MKFTRLLIYVAFLCYIFNKTLFATSLLSVIAVLYPVVSYYYYHLARNRSPFCSSLGMRVIGQ